MRNLPIVLLGNDAGAYAAWKAAETTRKNVLGVFVYDPVLPLDKNFPENSWSNGENGFPIRVFMSDQFVADASCDLRGYRLQTTRVPEEQWLNFVQYFDNSLLFP